MRLPFKVPDPRAAIAANLARVIWKGRIWPFTWTRQAFIRLAPGTVGMIDQWVDAPTALAALIERERAKWAERHEGS